ncbi:MAG: AAA family ATPase [Chloroflexota bacterium]|nr:AAA family ATPase [Chloroflexota bacterium]
MLRCYLLGRLRIASTDPTAPPVALPALRKAQGLLAYLLLFHSRPHARDHLAALFWGDGPQERALPNLSTALKQLRRTLAITDLRLITDRFSVQLDLGSAWLDTVVLEAGLAQADRGARAAALPLYSAPLLEDWPAEWCAVERARLHALVQRSGFVLLQDQLAAAAWSEAVAVAQHLLRYEPLDERLHEALLRAWLGAGEYTAARRHYEAFAALLRHECDTAPAPAVQALYAAAAPPARLSAGVPGTSSAAVTGPPAGNAISPFVGRAAELAALQAALARLRQGQGGLLLVCGEAGVGKTRLVQEALAAGGVARIAWARCFVPDRGVPFGPLRDPLRQWLVTDLAPAQVRERLGPVAAAALTNLLPDLAARLPGLPTLAPLPPAEAYTRLLGSVVTAVQAAAGRGSPVVLVLDDLQWSDDATLAVLDHLQTPLAATPLLVITTLRSEEAAPSSRVAELLDRWEWADVPLVDLAPLGRAEVGALVEPRMPGAAATLSDWIYTRSAGNPFFVTELIQGLLGAQQIVPDPVTGGYRLTGHLPTASTPVTRTARAGVLARFRRLNPPAQILVQLAAAMGGEISFPLLTAAGALPAATALPGLEEALARRFLMERTATGGYLPAHDVIREAIYSSLSAARRLLLHEGIAAALEATTDGLPNGGQIAQLAYHYGKTANHAKQRHYFRLAADTARAAYSNPTALDYYQRLLPLLPPGEQSPVLLALGDVQQLVGQWGPAEANYRRAAAQVGEHAPHQQAQVHAALGKLLVRNGCYEEAGILLGHARITLNQAQDSPGLLQALEGLGEVYIWRGDYAQAVVCYTQMLDVALAAGELGIAGDALGMLSMAYSEQGQRDQEFAAVARWVELVRQSGDVRRLTRAVGRLGYQYQQRGDFAQALRLYGERWRLASVIGDHQFAGLALHYMGGAYARRNAPNLALACYIHAMPFFIRMVDRYDIVINLVAIAHLYVLQARYAEAGRCLRGAWSLGADLMRPWYLQDYLLLLADWHFRQHDYGPARACTERVLELQHSAPRADIGPTAEILLRRIAVAEGTESAAAACTALHHTLAQCADRAVQTNLYYAIWQLDPAQIAARQAAARLYRALFAAGSAQLDVALRYAVLTGDLLTDPDLPPPPPEVPALPADLHPLLDQVEALLSHPPHLPLS